MRGTSALEPPVQSSHCQAEVVAQCMEQEQVVYTLPACDAMKRLKPVGIVTAKASPSHRAMKLRPLEAEQLEVDQKP